jgi:hypothetical protein
MHDLEPICFGIRKRIDPMPFISRYLSILAAGLCFLSSTSQAQEAENTFYFDHVSVFTAQGADHNLPELPEVILQGDLEWEPSYFTSVNMTKDFGRLGERSEAIEKTFFRSIEQSVEVLWAQHHGLQNNGELGAAYMLRTPNLNMGPVTVNAASGVGLSHAFGTPSYEDGPLANPSKRYRTQLLALFEVEWRIRKLENFSLVTRVHHRSGAYGLIAPRNVGSNFLAVGIRYDF